MNRILSILIILFSYSEYNWGQNKIFINSDSIFFLNVNKTYKLKVLKSYKSNPRKSYIFRDFPHSYFDSISKMIKITSTVDCIEKISSSTQAVVRVASIQDESYGSGGSDQLIQIKNLNQSYKIDSIIRIDSISQTGTFYLIIENRKEKFLKNKIYSFRIHHQVKTTYALFDYITDYSIENPGYISRKIEYDY